MRNSESDDELNLRDLVKKDVEWIEKCERLGKVNGSRFGSQRL
jgi:hypothetical protein